MKITVVLTWSKQSILLPYNTCLSTIPFVLSNISQSYLESNLERSIAVKDNEKEVFQTFLRKEIQNAAIISI